MGKKNQEHGDLNRSHLQAMQRVRFGKHFELGQLADKPHRLVLGLDVNLVLLSYLREKNGFTSGTLVSRGAARACARHWAADTHVETEVSFEHGAEILGDIGHARVQRGHQARVERQQVQSDGRRKGTSARD